jgi:hypothetical protein
VPFRAAYGVLTENVTANPPAGVFEWICHPSTIRRPEDKEIMDRPGELALLTDPALKTALERVGTRLANFGVLAERSSVVP